MIQVCSSAQNSAPQQGAHPAESGSQTVHAYVKDAPELFEKHVFGVRPNINPSAKHGQQESA
jgi:hypothetical protein